MSKLVTKQTRGAASENNLRQHKSRSECEGYIQGSFIIQIIRIIDLFFMCC